MSVYQRDAGVLGMRSSHAVHVARGASYITIQNLTGSAAMVVSFAILARLITPKEMGILAVLNLVNGLCQTVSTLALQRAATKFIAEYLGRNEDQVAASVFYQSLRATLLFAAPFALAVFLAASILYWSRILSSPQCSIACMMYLNLSGITPGERLSTS